MPTFATTDDVATRLGRDLTENESSTAEALLAGVAEIIATEAGRSQASVIDNDPPVPMLRIVSVEATVRAMQNPSGAQSVREQLGQYSRAVSFEGGESGVYLTDSEMRLARRAVNGHVGSVRVESILEDGCECS